MGNESRLSKYNMGYVGDCAKERNQAGKCVCPGEGGGGILGGMVGEGFRRRQRWSEDLGKCWHIGKSVCWGRSSRRRDRRFALQSGPRHLEALHPFSCPWNVLSACPPQA